MFKAVLANTVADFSMPGPDYANGYGLIQLPDALSVADSCVAVQVGQGDVELVSLSVDLTDSRGLRIEHILGGSRREGLPHRFGTPCDAEFHPLEADHSTPPDPGSTSNTRRRPIQGLGVELRPLEPLGSACDRMALQREV